uniref:Transmembrane protein 26-like n=1 Tax=Saccoglossus kowalevskii TaxID=10224 RepID=A0ABM0LZJ3_SACKO|nr:PREDICTED: transmembrane protein 26-like [Saccoglossus kowalevskii]
MSEKQETDGKKEFKCFVVTKALVTRSMFAIHSIVAIWRVTHVMGDALYWLLSIALLGLGVETMVTMIRNRGEEWTWFCPSCFFYLGSLVPSIWILELDLLDKRIASFELTMGTTEEIVTDDWTLALEQILLFILIIGRWMLPKGQITRDQLSQLLLVYIGVAADIIEFFEVFKEDSVKYNRELIIVTLTLWTWSLMQFTLVVTVTKSSKPRLAMPSPAEDEIREDSDPRCVCLESDAWGIAVTLSLQDGPFLIYRLILIIKYNVVTHMNIFFTVKNILIIILQVYRLIVVQIEKSEKKAKEERELLETLRNERLNNTISGNDSVQNGVENSNYAKQYYSVTDY